MKNVTLAIDDEIHRQARIRAAELGTSLSALVKGFLIGLAAGTPPASGVREMPMPFKHAEPAKAGPPWLIDGQWVYTKDGKPRQPGSMRGMWVTDDFDDTPEWLIDAMEGKDSELPPPV